MWSEGQSSAVGSGLRVTVPTKNKTGPPHCDHRGNSMMLPRIVSLPIAMVLLLTMAACAGGAVEVNTGPTATTTPGVNPTTIPRSNPISPRSNPISPGITGQRDACNCHGYAGIGGPCYDGIGGPAYAGIGGPAYAGIGGPCYSGIGGSGKNCPSICKRKK